MLIFADKQFDRPIEVITAFCAEDFFAAFEAIEKLKDRYYLAGYLRYEAAALFENERLLSSTTPYLYFEVFDRYRPYVRNAAPHPFSLEAKPALSFDAYHRAIQHIKTEIMEGNTYEVNYTYDYHIDIDRCRAFELFEYLLPEQTTPYNAFIQNEWDTILSFSPELFFRIEEHAGLRHIMTKPMKGTVRRGGSAEEDAALKAFLRQDDKNRAENVMIVDLMRNDLGQIARFGSVKVTSLFDIETHPTVHQMTSQIEADINKDTTLFQVFKALFPCGSITGAPKRSTMRIIEDIESGPRGVYCGALGLLSPSGGENGCERALFSVPIRILRRSRDDGVFKYRVGGAVVWDSNAAGEWKETITKSRFLHAGFHLFETMRVEQKVIHYYEEHIVRLKASARCLGFVWNEQCALLEPEQDGIMRLALDRNGSYTVSYRPLTQAASNAVRISPLCVDSQDIFLRHKTSYRPLFQSDYHDCFDELFFNERGELTEGSRSNIIVELDGLWWTPDERSGLLPGILRQKLLNEGRCRTRVLFREDLLAAAALYCVNSVRGIVPVCLRL